MPREFVVTAPYTIAFRAYEEPDLQPDQLRVRAIVSGIKHGTEMSLYSGDTPFRDQVFDPELRMFLPGEGRGLYPCRLGSWLVGEVVETGSAITAYRPGDIVHGEMAHRPTNVVSEARVFPLKPGMQPELAVFTDPAIFALSAIHDAQVKVGDNIAVYGMGALGLIAIQIARLNGAQRVFAVDRLANRLALAKQFGADEAINAAETDPAVEIKRATGNQGVDAAIDISGAYAALQSAIRSVQPGGLLVSASYFKGSRSALDLGAEWHHNRLTLVGSMPVWGMPHRCAPMWDLERLRRTALSLVESGQVQVAPMITQRYRYEQASDAYRFIHEHPEAGVKTLLDY